MIMFNYLNIIYEKCDETLIVEVMQCVHKQLAQLIGAHLAYCYISSANGDKEKFEKANVHLKSGV